MTPWDSQHGIFGQNSIMHPQCSFLKILLLPSSCPRWPQPSVTSAAGWCPLCEPCCVATPVTNPWSTTAALSIVRVPEHEILVGSWRHPYIMVHGLSWGWSSSNGQRWESKKWQFFTWQTVQNSSGVCTSSNSFCCKPKANLGDGFKNVFILFHFYIVGERRTTWTSISF